MNLPTGSRAMDDTRDERERGRDNASGYPSKRVRMSPSVATATTNTASGTAEASPANSTSTYLGASPPSTSHLDTLTPQPHLERSNSDVLIDLAPAPGDGHGHGQYPAQHTGEGLEKVENKLAPKTGSSSFRNVSACNRCRLRKNRCDQRLPSCASCGKAGVRCTGYDPITKREIPRSYVYYLESRVEILEGLLNENGISFPAPEELDHSARLPVPDPVKAAQGEDWRHPTFGRENENPSEAPTADPSQRQTQQEKAQEQRKDDENKLDKLVSNVGMISVAGASDPRYLGSTSGISFARVVFAAVKSSVSGTNSDKGSTRSASDPSRAAAKAIGPGGTSMRDSFFGLQTKPTITPAPFPDRELALRLVDFYFEHANPQVPILHRGEFMKMFNAVYSDEKKTRTPRQSYMLNIVFAIGAGIYLGDPDTEPDNATGTSTSSDKKRKSEPAATKKAKDADRKKGGHGQAQPEEYHASAIVHLEACLQSTMPVDRPDGFGGGLEELQAVLLLAGFALLRPVAPGLWYITGVAVRLAVDLGLHYEDGKDIDSGLNHDAKPSKKEESKEHEKARLENSLKEKGRREWMRDFRRRLWWCTYSFDRLVSTCVGRPFGITDQAITTEFPSLLEDKYITPTGFLAEGYGQPSSKRVAYHYFRFRLLQSEILQVLQYQQAQIVRASTTKSTSNAYLHAELPSPFLAKHQNFIRWRRDIDHRLAEWVQSAPTRADSGVKFSHEFMELNYWQAVIMLYRQSLSTPQQFQNEYHDDEVESPEAKVMEEPEDEIVFLKVANAGRKVLHLYRQLHRIHLVNYTFLATHHLFMAGISFLYAIWHSPLVRSKLSLDDVDFTILAATSVLTDLVGKCPPAEACRDAFDRMSKATVAMCMSSTGFSNAGVGESGGLHSRRRPPPQQQLQQQRMLGQVEVNPEVRRSENDAEYFQQLEMQRQQQQMRNGFAVSNARGQPVQQQQQQQQQRRQQSQQVKPRPQFDMGLNDLYAPSPVLANRSVLGNKRNSIGGQIKSEDSPVAFSIPRSEDPTPNPLQQQSRQSQSQSQQQQPQPHYGLSPPPTNFTPAPPSMSETSPMSPGMILLQRQNSSGMQQQQQQQPQSQQQQQNYLTSPTTSLTPTNLSAMNYYPVPASGSQSLNTNMEVDFSNLPEFSNLDFLNDPSLGMGGYGNGDVAMNGMSGMDGVATAGGVNLGFGWGAEGEGHDFSEGGNGLDFFDGFYFGTGV